MSDNGVAINRERNLQVTEYMYRILATATCNNAL